MALSTERSAAGELDGLRLDILRRTCAAIRAAGLDEHEIGCHLDGAVSKLTVELSAPALAAAVQDALRVRVLDAVHADGRTFGRVEVAFRFDGAPA